MTLKAVVTVVEKRHGQPLRKRSNVRSQEAKDAQSEVNRCEYGVIEFILSKFLFNTFCRGERQKSMRVPYCLQGRIPHSDFDLSSASSVDEFITDEVHFSLLFIEKMLRKCLSACCFSFQYNDTNTESFEALCVNVTGT